MYVQSDKLEFIGFKKPKSKDNSFILPNKLQFYDFTIQKRKVNSFHKQLFRNNPCR